MTPTEWHVLQSVALAALLAWASGLRLYLGVFAIGMGARFGYLVLPHVLEVLSHSWVIAAAAVFLVAAVWILALLWRTLRAAWSGYLRRKQSRYASLSNPAP